MSGWIRMREKHTQTRLLLASANPGKAAELERILSRRLAGRPWQLLTAADFPSVAAPEETGDTFEANALLKARFYARATGLATLADDSGLVVDALDGRPGIASARYAADDAGRIGRVLAELEGTPPRLRTARFVCVAALADPGGHALTRRGEVHGRIALAPRGGGGFGYDPIFELIEPPHAGRTMAELAPEQKDALSHRGRALELIASTL